MSLYADEVYDESEEELTSTSFMSSSLSTKPPPSLSSMPVKRKNSASGLESMMDLEEEEEEEDEEEDEDEEDAYDDGVELKEQMYQSKLAELKHQLYELQCGQLPDYSRRLRRLDAQYRDRIKFNAGVKEFELESIESDFMNEKRAAAREFEEQKVYLREQLIAELEEKQRNIEADRYTMELTSNDNLELKTISTRKLRRRVNDNNGNNNGNSGGNLNNGGSNYGYGDKRRSKSNAITAFSYQLEDADIHEDLKIINKNKVFSKSKSSSSYPLSAFGPVSSSSMSNAGGSSELLASSGSSSSPAHSSASGGPGPDLRVEDGKLFYERRWFRRGQSVQVEHKTQPMHRYPATITAIGSDDLWVRKSGESNKVRIFLSQLAKGKIVIKRRAN